MPSIYFSSSKKAQRKSPPKGITSDNFPTRTYDAFGRKYLPSDYGLIKEYKRTVYTCANLNTTGVVDTPLKLYLKTENPTEKTILRKGIDLKPISKEKKEFLSSEPYLQKTLRSFLDIEEVVRHPILDLLETANESRHLNGHSLFEFTQLFQEIAGAAYWLIGTDIFKLPKRIWILPTQYVFPRKNSNSRSIVDIYEFNPPGAVEPVSYKPADIIPFLMPSLSDPYKDYQSPLQASFQSVQVDNKLLSHEDGLLTNEGRPDYIVTPKDSESAFGGDEARRYERQLNMKFSMGRSGGFHVVDDPISLEQVTLPPRDLARLEISKWSRNDICNSYAVPFGLISGEVHNRTELEAAMVMHARYAVRPRTRRNACVLNDLLVPAFDPTGRLFLAYDDPVPEDRKEKLQEVVQLTMNGLITPNEGREQYNKPPHKDGDELRPINVSPEMMRDNRRERGDDESTEEK